MKITLKPLKRKDIQLQEIELSVAKQQVGNLFYPEITSLNISDKYSASLKVFLKVKQNANVLSYICGTVQDIKLPPSSFLKDYLDQNLAFTFFIQLIDPDTNAVIASMKKPQLASVHKITSQQNSPINIISMPTSPKLWDMKINPGEKPTIYISDEVSISDNLKSNSIFLSSILPIAVEKILDYMIDNIEQIDEEFWYEDWQKLFSILKVSFPESNAEIDDFENFKATFIERWLKLMKQKLYDPALQALNMQSSSGDDFNGV